jgi:hypothetical protein
VISRFSAFCQERGFNLRLTPSLQDEPHLSHELPLSAVEELTERDRAASVSQTKAPSYLENLANRLRPATTILQKKKHREEAAQVSTVDLQALEAYDDRGK